MASNHKKQNWRSRNQITQEVQADLRKKGITIESKKVLKATFPKHIHIVMSKLCAGNDLGNNPTLTLTCNRNGNVHLRCRREAF